ncbi:MAG: lipoprotein-releasing system ATP-binding protein LolD [Candidatus Nealsonbacteria bacterium CG02_land_8_20_14_3_00_37_10]|uniref:Lipoprotein-releasing system ATP-binding protein LolD n=2 Tax=Candidatus Nealsoniibacteriota TaxID=1817911 RepID=A0A2G9YY83_9BACT|nr:MAG: lipoprotein-releasing system ATP-binding protein LolD [Candidatus Nealsonbacteria bacterium CG23_combo_of_CG06-09_8_20_14_all_37_18]PIV45184.1 MAG: lipoprotein-releasing system ATP-binding protein LolD [Candidatus Nealsonbacteria bacterium CG02_land_8_20_14_3_00_37_10]
MPEPIIKLENVWKIYQLGKVELPALRGIDLEIAPGSFVSIMGPSGSGKSTLLNMIGALDFPTRGKVILKGKDIARLSEDELSLLRGKTMGFVFQEFNILPNLTALENVILPMIFQGVLSEKRKKRAKEILISVGLEDRISHQPAELSAGERQRVAIARAFANDPELVIADEPTGNLDSVTGKKIMEILTDFHQKEGKTIVVVTHDPNIASYSEKIVNIKDGQIIVNHKQAKEVLWAK